MDVVYRPGGKYLSTGEVQEGKGSGSLPDQDQVTGSALRLEESRDGRCYRPGGEIFINWGGPGGEGCRCTSSVKTRRMTGSVFEVREASWTLWLNLYHIFKSIY